MTEEYNINYGIFDLPEFHHERFNPDSPEKIISLEDDNKNDVDLYVKRFIKNNADKKWSSIFIKNKSYYINNILLDKKDNELDVFYKDLDNLKNVILKDKSFFTLLEYLKANVNKSKLLNFIYHKTLLDFNLFCKFYFNSKHNVLINDFNKQAIEFIKQTFVNNKTYFEWFSFMKNIIMRNIKNMFINVESNEDESIVKIGIRENIFCSIVFNYMFDSNVNISSALVNENTEFYKTLNNIYNNKSCFGYKEVLSPPPFKYYYFKYCTYNIYSNILNVYNIYRTKNNSFVIAKI